MKVGKKIAVMVASIGTLVFSLTGVASAHIVVEPSDAKTGADQTFTVGVPVERDNPTVKVRLVIPAGLTSVTPTVKPGWTIKTEKQGEGADATISSITWSGGEIGANLRDEFTFSAKTPDNPVDLQWRAYQTYKDGTVVSWDQQASSDDKEGATTGSFSVTKVAADSDQDKALKTTDSKASSAMQTANGAFFMSIGSIILAAIAIATILVRKPKNSN
jgi:uncharacterized protein YcnI